MYGGYKKKILTNGRFVKFTFNKKRLNKLVAINYNQVGSQNFVIVYVYAINYNQVCSQNFFIIIYRYDAKNR